MLSSQINDQARHINVVETENAKLLAEVRELQGARDELDAARRKIKRLTEELADVIEEKDLEITDLTAANVQLQEDLDKTLQELLETKSERDRIQREKDEQERKFKMEIEALTVRVDKAEEENYRLTTENAKLAEANRLMEEELQDARNALLEAEKRAEQAEAEIERLAKALEDTERQLVREQARADRLQQWKDENEPILRALQIENPKMKVEIKRLRLALKDVKKELREYMRTAGKVLGVVQRMGNALIKVGGGYMYATTYMSQLCGADLNPRGPSMDQAMLKNKGYGSAQNSDEDTKKHWDQVRMPLKAPAAVPPRSANLDPDRSPLGKGSWTKTGRFTEVT